MQCEHIFMTILEMIRLYEVIRKLALSSVRLKNLLDVALVECFKVIHIKVEAGIRGKCFESLTSAGNPPGFPFST